jgi:hypothetical protein
VHLLVLHIRMEAKNKLENRKKEADTKSYTVLHIFVEKMMRIPEHQSEYLDVSAKIWTPDL